MFWIMALIVFFCDKFGSPLAFAVMLWMAGSLVDSTKVQELLSCFINHIFIAYGWSKDPTTDQD